METAPKYAINIDNFEDVYHKAVERANRKFGELVYIFNGYEPGDDLKDPKARFIFLTNQIKLERLASAFTDLLQSIINDSALSRLQIELSDANSDNLFELVRDLLIGLPNLRRLEFKRQFADGRSIVDSFSEKNCADLCEGLKKSRSLKEFKIEATKGITDVQLKMISDAINNIIVIEANPRIHTLQLTSNDQFDSIPWPELTKLLEKSNITNLSLRDVYFLMREDAEALVSSKSATSYHSFHLRNVKYTIALLKKNWNLVDLDLETGLEQLFEPLLTRNRQYQLGLKLVMYNITRQETQIPLDIWRLIFWYLTPDLSIFA